MADLIATLSDLVRINSVNAFYENGPGEADLARYVEGFFARHGVETWQQNVIDATGAVEARCNVIARLPGFDPSRRIVLEAHLDTVSVQGMTIAPFEPRVEDGRLYGRGSCDTKAGLAAMMHAVVNLKVQNVVPPCDVLLAAVVDEEYSFQGVRRFCEELKADAAIVAEPTDLRIAIASKGVLRWRIHARGKSAHSSKVHLGVNAIYHMARVVLALEQTHAALAHATHPLLGSASGSVGKIVGGVQVNFVPDHCVIEIDRRLLPMESIAEVWGHYEQVIDRLKQEVHDLDVRMEEPMLIDEAWAVDPSSAIVRVSRSVLHQMAGNDEPIGVPFGSDASKLGRAGVPTIIFGPGSIDQAHAAVEYVEIKQVEKATEFYKRCLMEFR